MTEHGIVTEINNNKVLIRAAGNPGCSKCGARNICNSGNDGYRYIWAENDIDINIGDNVEFSTDERKLVVFSIMLYLIPAIDMLIGGVIGYYIPLFSNREINIAVFALLFLIGSIVFTSLMMKKIGTEKMLCANVVKKL